MLSFRALPALHYLKIALIQFVFYINRLNSYVDFAVERSKNKTLGGGSKVTLATEKQVV